MLLIKGTHRDKKVFTTYKFNPDFSKETSTVNSILCSLHIVTI